MESPEIDDKTLCKLLAYFDKRFHVLEKEIQKQSNMLNTISTNVRKLMDSQPKTDPVSNPMKRESSSKDSYKEFTLQKSLHEQFAELPKGPHILTQRSNEGDHVNRTQFAELKNQEFLPNQANVKSRNKENFALGPAQTEPYSKKTAKQSPSFGKYRHENEENSMQKKVQNSKENTKRKDIRLDSEETSKMKSEKTEDLSINSVFSPNQHTGESKELIIEPIDVMFQESPKNSSSKKNSKIIPAQQIIKRDIPQSKYSYRSKSPNNESSSKHNKSLNLFKPRKSSHVEFKFDQLPGNCLLLIGQYMGCIVPPFVFTCRSIMDKYVIVAGKKAGENIISLKEQLTHIAVFLQRFSG